MMLNNYITPPILQESNYHEHTPAEEYDLNFIFPIPDDLVSEGVILSPCIPSLHARFLHSELSPAIETDLYKYLPYGPFSTFEGFLTFLESKRADSTVLLFVAFDQSLIFSDQLSPELESKRPERIVGLLGMLQSSQINRQSEIGNVHILPKAQKSHVTTHAVGLLLKWMLEVERVRRVCWYANHYNVPSVNCALRLGFLSEGILRWDRVLPRVKAGVGLTKNQLKQEREAGRGETGRHSSVLSIGWDDWEEGREGKIAAKLRIEELMARKVHKRNA